MRAFYLTTFLAFFTLISLSQTPCVNGMSGGYPCSKVDMLSHMTSLELGGGEMNDLWGWTDTASGREFVMIGRDAGTSFVEITDPLNPVYVGYLLTHTSNSIWRDIKVYSDHAFIVSEANNHGMQVFDLTELLTASNFPVAFSETAHYGLFGKCHNIAINEESGYAYAVGSNTASGGLHIIDISNPAVPVIAGLFSGDGYTHDAQVVNYIGPDADHAGKEIAFACNENNVTIVDVTDKTDTELISHGSYPSPSYTHQGWLTEDHKFFLANDELDEYYNGGVTRTFVFDVQDLDNPILIGTYNHSTASIDHNLYIKDNYVYESNYRAGLRILDATDVANGNLVEAAYFDVYPQSNSAQFNGSWSNYPYFDSGVIAVSHIEGGLFLLEPVFTKYYLDSDEDSYGDISISVDALLPPDGYVTNSLDCDDTNDLVYDGATGTQEGIDNDCNGEVEGDELIPNCPGDLNGDLAISALDISLLIGDFGCINSSCVGDVNEDGFTGILDLALLLTLFGTTCN